MSSTYIRCQWTRQLWTEWRTKERLMLGFVETGSSIRSMEEKMPTSMGKACS